MPSLREIEQTVATLWLNRQARQWLMSAKKGPRPECLKDAPEEVLQTVDRKGIELYGGLISYGHQDVMESIYPFCSKLLGKKWKPLVEDYLLRCPAQHHNFNRLCAEFPQYVSLYCTDLLDRYPFLAELADYEWIEMEKLEDECRIVTQAHAPLETPEQIATLCPVVNPTVTIREYKYDITNLADRLEHDRKLPRTIKPERTLVAIYRHPETYRCDFVEIGQAAAQLIEAARKPVTYQSLIPLVIALTPELPPQETVTQFLEVVEELQELGVFVGSVKEGN